MLEMPAFSVLCLYEVAVDVLPALVAPPRVCPRRVFRAVQAILKDNADEGGGFPQLFRATSPRRSHRPQVSC
eukprot:scaffold7595_cov267-Pinguiococcus_pyrenoidosus.AAC.8